MNIAVFSRHATSMSLLLFDDLEAVEPMLAVDLDPADHRTVTCGSCDWAENRAACHTS